MKAQLVDSITRLLAPALLLFGVGCSDASSPLTTEANPPRRATTHNLNPPGPVVLRGTILTPDGAITHGYVGIVDGRIVSVSQQDPNIPEAVTINTRGIIAPGLVDIHNHVPWNALPRWNPGRVFGNRNQWRNDPEYLAVVGDPFNRLMAGNSCDMNTWGELRALVGGTTSTMVSRPMACIHGLVRNLDFNSGFYGTTELDREHIFNVLDLPPASAPLARAGFVAAAQFFISNPFYEALLIHAAEGTDAESHEEFTFLRSQNLLNPKGAIIHGLTLSAADFADMAAAGSALIWSPRSNLELYRATADVGAALDAGVDIALAPDWAITGSGNMLDELKVAALWNVQRLGGRLGDRKLFDMVTAAPARIAGVDDEVGAIRVGLRADLLVITGSHGEPFRSLISATPDAIQLVMIGGVALYGDRTLMDRFWARTGLEELDLPFGKALATGAAGFRIGEVEARLTSAMRGEGISLAPLTERPE